MSVIWFHECEWRIENEQTQRITKYSKNALSVNIEKQTVIISKPYERVVQIKFTQGD